VDRWGFLTPRDKPVLSLTKEMSRLSSLQ